MYLSLENYHRVSVTATIERPHGRIIKEILLMNIEEEESGLTKKPILCSLIRESLSYCTPTKSVSHSRQP